MHRKDIQTTMCLPKPYSETQNFNISIVRAFVMSCRAVTRTPKHAGVVCSNLHSSDVSPQHSSMSSIR